MRFKSTYVLLLLFLALALYVYFSEVRGKEASRLHEESAKKVIPAEVKEIAEIRLQYPGLILSAVRSGETQWSMQEPAGVEGDSDEWERLAGDLVRIQREDVVAGSGVDLAQFGLDKPAVAASIRLADGSRVNVAFGSENPRKTFSYAKLDNAPEVFLSPGSWAQTLRKSINDMRNKKVVTFDIENVDGIKITEGARAIDLKKDGTDWMLQKPVVSPADNAEVTGFLATLQQARAVDFVDSAADLSLFGLVPPAAQIVVHDGKAGIDHILYLGKEKESKRRFAKDAARVPVFVVDNQITDRIQRPLFEWRDKAIGRLDADAVDEILIHRSAGSVTLHKSAGEWALSDGRKLQESKISALLNSVQFERSLSIVDQPGVAAAYGLSSPRLEIDFRKGGKELLKLDMGVESKSPAGVYLRTSADARVRVVSQGLFDRFNVQAVDLLAQPVPAKP